MLAGAGVASRRACEALIEAGKVKVNGVVVQQQVRGCTGGRPCTLSSVGQDGTAGVGLFIAAKVTVSSRRLIGPGAPTKTSVRHAVLLCSRCASNSNAVNSQIGLVF